MTRGHALEEVPLVLLGYGSVGRSFAELLEEREGFSSSGARLVLRAVFDRGGGVSGGALRGSELSRCKREKGSVAQGSSDAARHPPPLEDVLSKIPHAVLVDTCPTNPSTGQPGLSYVRDGLQMGHSVVFADKGPLIVAYEELATLADRSGARLGLSAAIGTPLPAIEIALLGLHGCRVRAFRGILNQTANCILRDMEEGAQYEEAIENARRAGILEADPRLDVGGWDAAFKALLLARVLWSADVSLDDARIEGIESFARATSETPRRREGRQRLVASAERSGNGRVRIDVRVESLDSRDPLFALAPSEKGLVFETDLMGRVFVRTTQSGPRATAAALVKDVLNLAAHPPVMAL